MKQEAKKQKRFNDYSFPDRRKGASELKEFIPDKEGLHTQGEWKLENNSSFNQIGDRLIIRAEVPSQNLWEQVAEVLPLKTNLLGGTAQANAELIVKAVNERKALLDSHRQLLSAMNLVLPILENPKDADKYLFRVDIFKEAINNAKNI